MAIHLKAARINAGLTQNEVVERLKTSKKISKTTLANYENYKTIPDIETAKLLASLYGLTVDDIIFFNR